MWELMQSLTNILKETYLPVMKEQLNHSIFMTTLGQKEAP